MKYFFVSSFVIALSIQGCKKGTDTGQLPPNDSLTVHFATFGIESEGGNPNYWKNGTKIILPTTGNGGDVFAISASTKLAAGRVYQGLGWHRYSPCYWSGSNRTDLPLLDPRGNGWLTAIDYDGGDIFAAGNATDSLEFFGNSGWRNLPCYWHNGEITALELLNGFGNGMAYAVAKAATDVYIAGESFADNGYNEPCVWSLGTTTSDFVPNQLSSFGYGGSINDIYLTNSDRYFAGYIFNTDGESVACYWHLGSRVDLSGQDGQAKAICLKGLVACVAGKARGVSSLVPCMWVNGVKTDLPDLGYGSEVLSIQTSASGDIYVGGWVSSNGTNTHPCYWKNGELFYNSSINCIPTAFQITF